MNKILLGLRSERFQEAFERFESVVDIDSFDSYKELLYGFEHWSGRRWVGSNRQFDALAYEGNRLGFKDVFIPIPRVRWTRAYERKVKRVRRVVKRKYKGIGKVRIKALSWYVSHHYSANKIQRKLKARGLGIRRKTLLKIVREMKLRKKKVKVKKYIPKKYRKKKK